MPQVARAGAETFPKTPPPPWAGTAMPFPELSTMPVQLSRIARWFVPGRKPLAPVAPAPAGAPAPAPVPEPAGPDWLALVQQVAVRVDEADTLPEALWAATTALAEALDASEHAVLRVLSVSGEATELQAWSPPDDPHPARFTVHPRLSTTGRAVTEGSICLTPLPASGASLIAIPVHGGHGMLAVLELRAVLARRELPALRRVLDTVQRLVDLRAGQCGPAEPPAPDPRVPEPALLQLLMENLPVSLFVLTAAERRLVAINVHAEREFGRRREDAIGRTVDEAFGPEIGALSEPSFARALAGHETIESEVEVPAHPDGGAARVVSARYFALRDPDGSPRLLIVLARDISGERRAERELHESQSRLREFADTVEDSLFVTTPARDRFHFLTDSSYDTWGTPRDEWDAAPQAFLSRVLPEDRHLLDARRALEEQGQPADVRVRIQHPAKGLRWLRSRTRSRRTPDGELRVYGLVCDVTEEMERETELKRARDTAEAASQAKSQFMANMSHEIRTPMNGILGMTELLLGTALSDKQKRFAQAVYRSGEALLEIINDILDFSKIEAGRLELAPVDFSLRAVVEDTLELLAPRAHEKGLELSFREEPGMPALVHGDPLRLRQVLTNLVANAIKFTEAGEIVVDVRMPMPAQGADGALWLEFEVRDTGIGIEDAVVPRLFNAFTQAHGGMSRRYGGTGLGLAISKQLVELMGGDIEVQSSPGIGSRFIFSMPLAPAASGDAVAAGLELAQMPALRVLVVEDHETNRTVLDNMLGAWGMQVVLAEDGRRALDILSGASSIDPRFDLALVDMNMPRLDGMGLALALQAQGPGRRSAGMKMILLSSVSSPDDARAAQRAGYDRFVAKPVRKAELRQAILGISSARGDASRLTPRLNALILVIEDNAVNQEVIGQMLRSLGCQVQVCASALDGLRALCEKRYDLVLMDIQMPGMDGVEALNWFRRSRSGRFDFLTPPDTPVIAVTANALGGDEERFLELGFDDYLSKPFRQSQLLAMLAKRLRPAAPVDSEGPAGAGRAIPPAVATPAPAAAAATDGVLDALALDRLRELDPSGENQLLERVMKAFENSLERLLPQLQDAQASHDLTGIRHVVHTLKSSSASIGALKLSHICAEIEAMVRREATQGMDELIVALQAEVTIVVAATRRLLGR